jgi:prepilin-type N-terminal cleavage/methylation domain-containing protein
MSLRGYTLLELMIVLFIFALLTGMVAPRLMTMYDSVQAAYQRDDIASQISSLSYQAYQQGINFRFETYPFNTSNEDYEILKQYIILDIPENWKIIASEPIVFRANGACTGGKVSLQYGEVIYPIELVPPFCRAKLYEL